MGSLPIKIHSHVLVIEQMEGRRKAGMEEVEKIKEGSRALARFSSFPSLILLRWSIDVIGIRICQKCITTSMLDSTSTIEVSRLLRGRLRIAIDKLLLCFK